MAEQQLIGALEAGGTKMVCATGYAVGSVLERKKIATTTPQETVEAGHILVTRDPRDSIGSEPDLRDSAATPCISPQTKKGRLGPSNVS